MKANGTMYQMVEPDSFMKELAVLRNGSVLKAMARSSWRISFRQFQGIFSVMQ